jgi:hypothetical protein
MTATETIRPDARTFYIGRVGHERAAGSIKQKAAICLGR